MSINANQSQTCAPANTAEAKKYYIPLPKTEQASTGYIEFYRDYQLTEVSEEVYRAYYQPIWRTWKRAKRNGSCSGEDWKNDIKNFGDYLYNNAGESILAWIIEGAKRVIDAGYHFTLPECVQRAIDEYRIQNDWFTHFLEDRCEIAPSYREGSSALYQAYRNYCTDTNEYVRSTTDFYFAVEKAGFTKLNLSGRKFIKGLRLKADGGDFEDFLQ